MARIRRLSLAVLVVLPMAGLAWAKPAAGRRPNVILVMTDDQGQNGLSGAGEDPVRSPHLDRFYACWGHWGGKDRPEATIRSSMDALREHARGQA